MQYGTPLIDKKYGYIVVYCGYVVLNNIRYYRLYDGIGVYKVRYIDLVKRYKYLNFKEILDD